MSLDRHEYYMRRQTYLVLQVDQKLSMLLVFIVKYIVLILEIFTNESVLGVDIIVFFNKSYEFQPLAFLY